MSEGAAASAAAAMPQAADPLHHLSGIDIGKVMSSTGELINSIAMGAY